MSTFATMGRANHVEKRGLIGVNAGSWRWSERVVREISGVRILAIRCWAAGGTFAKGGVTRVIARIAHFKVRELVPVAREYMKGHHVTWPCHCVEQPVISF